jgi:hypothetical protein
MDTKQTLNELQTLLESDQDFKSMSKADLEMWVGRMEVLGEIAETLEEQLDKLGSVMGDLETYAVRLDKLVTKLPDDCPVRKGLDKHYLAEHGDSIRQMVWLYYKVLKPLQGLQKEAASKTAKLAPAARALEYAED